MNKAFFLTLSLAIATTLSAMGAGNVFKVDNPDSKLSPYTGMTRRHWIEADKYLLEGAFGHIRSLDDPMYFDRLGNVCYPKDNSRVRGATLEGMCRTLFLASPLLREDSTLTINGIRLADYYRRQLSLLVDPDSKQYVAHRGNRGPCQDLVEFGALGISLFICGDVLWEPLPKATRDSLYSMIESYADGPTIPQNWRFFNVFPMSFFKSKGYEVNDSLLVKYVRLLQGDYRGDGWYLDHPNYDFYSMWAYQLYGELWARFFGREHYPELAAQFEKNFAEMYRSYPRMFGRDGHMPMWGRSNMYRFAAAAPLAWGEGINYGWMRRIASGCLLQFLQNPDFIYADGVPTPGFYGLFDPVLQGYSCRGSVYWCAKAFLPLMLPESHPYWSDTENEGFWAGMKAGEVDNLWLPGPKMLITNYANSGAAETRAFCDYDTERRGAEKFRGSEQYNRLAYNTLFPWMADGKNGEVAMAYVVKNAKGQWEPMRRYTTTGYADGTLHRTVWLQSDKRFTMSLADKTLPDGMMRSDSVTGCATPTTLRLGHYALPERDTPIKEATISLKNGLKAYTIYNGRHSLALVPIKGWGKVEYVRTEGLHPETRLAETINATADVNGPTELKTLMLFKEGQFDRKSIEKAIKQL